MNNVLKIGQHPDPIISDVCCYSQPCFDEAANFFHKLGEGGSPDHGSLPVARYECLWPRESRQKLWSRLRRNEGLIIKSNVKIVMQSRYQSHAALEYIHRWNGKETGHLAKRTPKISESLWSYNLKSAVKMLWPVYKSLAGKTTCFDARYVQVCTQ